MLKNPKIGVRCGVSSQNGVISIVNPMSTDDQIDELIRRVTALADEVGKESHHNCDYVEKLTSL